VQCGPELLASLAMKDELDASGLTRGLSDEQCRWLAHLTPYCTQAAPCCMGAVVAEVAERSKGIASPVPSPCQFSRGGGLLGTGRVNPPNRVAACNLLQTAVSAGSATVAALWQPALPVELLAQSRANDVVPSGLFVYCTLISPEPPLAQRLTRLYVVRSCNDSFILDK
jgi:hypothetical protein